MIAVAIETSSDRMSIALGRPGELPVERVILGARQHAAGLLPMLGALLEAASLTLTQVDAVALADGPGSFTGLRVGAAAVKGLVRARPGLEIWTASTLLVRAAGAGALHGAAVLVVSSALRGELYAAAYRMNLPHEVSTLLPPGLATPESLHAEAPDLLVADAPDRIVDRLATQFAVPLVRPPAGAPSAVALLGLIGVPGGAERVRSLDAWEPVYGRPAEAQARWEAAHGRTLSDSPRHAG